MECGECERDLRGGHDPSCSKHKPGKNWCPDCDRRPNDPVAALMCDNREFHKQPTSHGAGEQ